MATINFEKSRKNCLGTMDFVCKFGKMKKEQEFCIYPINDKQTKIPLQSSHRWVEISNEGKVMMSAHRNQYANSWSLIEDRIKGKAETDELTQEQFEKLKEMIRFTSGKEVGSSFVLSDNSMAASI